MLKKLLSLCVVVASAALMSCGDGDNSILDPGGGGGGGGTDPGTITVQMGSGTPPAFQPQQIAVAVANLSAGGSSSLTVTFVTSLNALYTQPVDVTFSSPCIAQGLASITGATSTSSGILTVTYGATGCSGSDVITASATVEGSILSATGSISVAAASVGSIEFISATPTRIGLKGTGGAGITETATVAFKVVDSTGGPVAGTDVQFSLDTAVGGIVFQPATATSGADGRVQTVIQSGTVATSVRVTGRVVSTNISTQSSQLTITTGLPDQNSVSLSVTCNNIEAWDIDGTQSDVTVRMSDRFNNPVPDGTAVTFNTEGGNIVGSCSTATTASESGICAVKWTSANPRPANGRSTLLATSIGEETFVDVNGNGVFDGVDTWTDIAEAFRDDNENGTYDAGEVFLDFNQDLVRSPGDGQFNGLLCVGPGSPAGGCSSNEKLTVSASNLIIMSGSTAKISDNAGGVLTGGGTVLFSIGDFRDQPLPAGTTITATSSNGKLVGPTSYEVPCTTANAPSQYSFTVEPVPTAPASGILTVTVEVPSGLQTIYFVTLND